MNEHGGARVTLYWQGKTEILGVKNCAVSFRPPRFYTDWPGTELGSLWREGGKWPSESWRGLERIGPSVLSWNDMQVQDHFLHVTAALTKRCEPCSEHRTETGFLTAKKDFACTWGLSAKTVYSIRQRRWPPEARESRPLACTTHHLVSAFAPHIHRASVVRIPVTAVFSVFWGRGLVS